MYTFMNELMAHQAVREEEQRMVQKETQEKKACVFSFGLLIAVIVLVGFVEGTL